MKSHLGKFILLSHTGVSINGFNYAPIPEIFSFAESYAIPAFRKMWKFPDVVLLSVNPQLSVHGAVRRTWNIIWCVSCSFRLLDSIIFICRTWKVYKKTIGASSILILNDKRYPSFSMYYSSISKWRTVALAWYHREACRSIVTTGCDPSKDL